MKRNINKTRKIIHRRKHRGGTTKGISGTQTMVQYDTNEAKKTASPNKTKKNTPNTTIEQDGNIVRKNTTQKLSSAEKKERRELAANAAENREFDKLMLQYDEMTNCILSMHCFYDQMMLEQHYDGKARHEQGMEELSRPKSDKESSSKKQLSLVTTPKMSKTSNGDVHIKSLRKEGGTLDYDSGGEMFSGIIIMKKFRIEGKIFTEGNKNILKGEFDKWYSVPNTRSASTTSDEIKNASVNLVILQKIINEQNANVRKTITDRFILLSLVSTYWYAFASAKKITKPDAESFFNEKGEMLKKFSLFLMLNTSFDICEYLPDTFNIDKNEIEKIDINIESGEPIELVSIIRDFNGYGTLVKKDKDQVSTDPLAVFGYTGVGELKSLTYTPKIVDAINNKDNYNDINVAENETIFYNLIKNERIMYSILLFIFIKETKYPLITNSNFMNCVNSGQPHIPLKNISYFGKNIDYGGAYLNIIPESQKYFGRSYGWENFLDGVLTELKLHYKTVTLQNNAKVTNLVDTNMLPSEPRIIDFTKCDERINHKKLETYENFYVANLIQLNKTDTGYDTVKTNWSITNPIINKNSVFNGSESYNNIKMGIDEVLKKDNLSLWFESGKLLDFASIVAQLVYFPTEKIKNFFTDESTCMPMYDNKPYFEYFGAFDPDPEWEFDLKVIYHRVHAWVNHEQKTIAICFRGTTSARDWYFDLSIAHGIAMYGNRVLNIINILDKIYEQLYKNKINGNGNSIVNAQAQNYRVFFMGHSLGGFLANSAAAIVHRNILWSKLSAIGNVNIQQIQLFTNATSIVCQPYYAGTCARNDVQFDILNKVFSDIEIKGKNNKKKDVVKLTEKLHCIVLQAANDGAATCLVEKIQKAEISKNIHCITLNELSDQTGSKYDPTGLSKLRVMGHTHSPYNFYGGETHTKMLTYMGKKLVNFDNVITIQNVDGLILVKKQNKNRYEINNNSDFREFILPSGFMITPP